ncbi:unnamed protein product [Psylliodes chrysocephalus]|uniref:Uncharacterized protein n=1 Tax=Psylliodes chrysocephalus TaxID=3402493 RepID=A0A9P0G9E3_9CUCU|nr:unnamed protein product [Psylliodes chrysocephala]
MNSKIQFYLFVCIFCLAFTYVNTKSSPLTRPQQIEVRTEQDALRKPQDIEVRDNYPGILEIIGAIFDVPKHILAFIAGKGPFSGITSAISDVIFQIRKFVSVQGIVGVIPILGYILQPLVGLMAMILYHIPFIGGIIRYILVGPSE